MDLRCDPNDDASVLKVAQAVCRSLQGKSLTVTTITGFAEMPLYPSSSFGCHGEA
jgi:hypothetical protein